MCGRFTLATPSEAWAEIFGVDDVPDLPPRYNIAPSQEVAAVRLVPDGSGRELAFLRWGLIPAWAPRADPGARTINARAETIDRRPSYRDAFRERRCLVVADGFYEWQPAGRRKKPYYVRLRDGSPFAFAGLWERWWGPAGSALDSCTIVTTRANDLLRPLHDRMPVILTPEQGAGWLDREGRPKELKALLRPVPDDALVFYPVGTQVNRTEFDAPECIAPLQEPRLPSQFRLDLP
ncbi:MAG: SOS response-associated peptidase [Gemmatimonadota bacterium]